MKVMGFQLIWTLTAYDPQFLLREFSLICQQYGTLKIMYAFTNVPTERQEEQYRQSDVRWLFSLLKYRIETAKQTSNPHWALWDWTEIIKWIITTLTYWWYCKDCISWNWNTKEWNLEIFVWACQQLRAYIGVFNYNHRLRQNKNISDKHTFTLIVYQNWKKNRLQKATLKHAVRDLPNRKQIFF